MPTAPRRLVGMPIRDLCQEPVESLGIQFQAEEHPTIGDSKNVYKGPTGTIGVMEPYLSYSVQAILPPNVFGHNLTGLAVEDQVYADFLSHRLPHSRCSLWPRDR